MSRRRFRFPDELDTALMALMARQHWTSFNGMVEHILWSHIARIRKPSGRPRGRPKVAKHTQGADNAIENRFVQT